MLYEQEPHVGVFVMQNQSATSRYLDNTDRVLEYIFLDTQLFFQIPYCADVDILVFQVNMSPPTHQKSIKTQISLVCISDSHCTFQNRRHNILFLNVLEWTTSFSFSKGHLINVHVCTHSMIHRMKFIWSLQSLVSLCQASWLHEALRTPNGNLGWQSLLGNT